MGRQPNRIISHKTRTNRVLMECVITNVLVGMSRLQKMTCICFFFLLQLHGHWFHACNLFVCLISVSLSVPVCLSICIWYLFSFCLRRIFWGQMWTSTLLSWVWYLQITVYFVHWVFYGSQPFPQLIIQPEFLLKIFYCYFWVFVSVVCSVRLKFSSWP